MSYSSGINESVVKTVLDDVFYQIYDVAEHPQYGTALTPAIFHQDTADSSAVIWELFKGIGLWETRQEEQDVPQKTPEIGNQKTFTVSAFAASVDIPKHFFDDAKHKVDTFSTVLVKLGELLGSPVKWIISSQARLGMV